MLIPPPPKKRKKEIRGTNKKIKKGFSQLRCSQVTFNFQNVDNKIQALFCGARVQLECELVEDEFAVLQTSFAN